MMTNINRDKRNLNVTDAHVHFWDTDLLKYPWLNSLPSLYTTFTPSDYLSDTQTIDAIKKVVFVQCECLPEQYLQEISYVTALANRHRNIQGIVAYFPLEAWDAAQQMEHLKENKLIKGIRRLEEDQSLYRNREFLKNMSLLEENNFSFDIGVKSHQLPDAVHLVQQQPGLNYMLDHLGKPNIKHKEFKEWAAAIKTLAQNPNVYCKISGMLTEADPQNWKPEHLEPYFAEVCEHFGIDRLVFGSDWPVVTLVDSYARWFETFLELTKTFSENDLEKILSENANRFYKLN